MSTGHPINERRYCADCVKEEVKDLTVAVAAIKGASPLQKAIMVLLLAASMGGGAFSAVRVIHAIEADGVMRTDIALNAQAIKELAKGRDTQTETILDAIKRIKQ